MRRLETFVLSFSLAGPRARQYAFERCFELQGGVGFEAYEGGLGVVVRYCCTTSRRDDELRTTGYHGLDMTGGHMQDDH
jgi:hypothetical protein